MNYIRVLCLSQKNVKVCCVFLFTETWLSDCVPDRGIRLDQLTCYRADGAIITRGKIHRDGLCVYINDAWCRNAAVV